MANSPKLALPYLEAAQAQKHVTVNESLRMLDALVQLTAISAAIGTPPGSPANGDAYIVPTGASGAWAGWDGSIAFYADNLWLRLVPSTGWRALDLATGNILVRTAGGIWDSMFVTSLTDSTDGRLLKVGAFGIGRAAGASGYLATGDLNDLKTAGLYSVQNGTLNRPGTGTVAMSCLVTVDNASGRVFQTGFRAASGANLVWTRCFDGTNWTAWSQSYGQNSILGTVSQASGVPTGAIIERGSNANGEYVRYADGTQICWFSPASISLAISTAAMGGFRSAEQTWTYPAAFSVTPISNTSVRGNTAFGAYTSNQTTTTCDWVVTAVTSQAAAGRRVNLMAIGAWF